jgi:heterodisulfide reductase subunit A
MGFRPKLDPEQLAVELREARIERVVIVGDSPGYFKPAFTRALALAGGEPGEVHLASFREHGACAPNEMDRAKAIIACAVEGVPYSLVAVPRETSIDRATLVVGAGIAGIQAALEIADSGNKVYLVERTPTIGGHMAMFDKTFPTLDCAACILTHKMLAVGEHKMIDLMTNSEVLEIGGEPGRYRVKVLQRARRVDPDACVACNVCTEIFPVSAWSEFDCRLVRRKAIYIPFPQAVPNTYVVDPENCLWTQSSGKRCGACVKKCPKDCIHLDEQDRTVEIEVGNVILATGYELFDAGVIQRYGYGAYPNVLTSLEFERMTNASGPTGGKIVVKTKKLNKRTKKEEWLLEPDGPPPQSVAIIHCVGSRDSNYNRYCSRICCVYSLKFAHLVREKLPQATCYEFYIDMRAFGKGYEAFMERIKSEGVHVVRGRSASVVQANGQMVVRGEDILNDRVVDFPVDLVILAGTSRIPYPPNIRIIRVMCSARVDPTFVLDALSKGADGVLICGCHPGDCHYSEGNYKAMRRFTLLKQVLKAYGLENERVRLEWVSASEGQRFADVVTDMTERVRALGPSRIQPALQADHAEVCS